MVLDTSAIVAILFGEPEATAFVALVAADAHLLISAATLVEAALVLEGRRGEEAGRGLDELLRELDVTVVPVDQRHAEAARRAWRRFGKGRHPAALNFGDYFSYALSTVSGEALLFKGDDFAQTDVRSAFV